MEELLAKVRTDYPDVSFEAGSRFAWHARKRQVIYAVQDKKSSWALLHELGHSLLDHTDYTSDIELLQMEVAAWQKAQELAQRYGLKIKTNYIEDCLDTYRDWLHLRATCPACFVRSIQTSPTTYQCYNCQTTWRVSRSRLCRPYRLQEA